MDVPQSLRDLRSGRLTFDGLVQQFQSATFTVRQPTEGGWGKVYARAEELPDDNDVPEQLASAAFRKLITRDQREELLSIYVQRLRKQRSH